MGKGRRLRERRRGGEEGRVVNDRVGVFDGDARAAGVRRYRRAGGAAPPVVFRVERPTYMPVVMRMPKSMFSKMPPVPAATVWKGSGWLPSPPAAAEAETWETARPLGCGICPGLLRSFTRVEEAEGRDTGGQRFHGGNRQCGGKVEGRRGGSAPGRTARRGRDMPGAKGAAVKSERW